MVMPRAGGVHGERTVPARRPTFPQGGPLRGMAPRPARARPGAGAAASELGNQLRPDRNHPDEKRDRRQRRSLFYECLQHGHLLILEHKKNIVPFLFSESSGGSGAV